MLGCQKNPLTSSSVLSYCWDNIKLMNDPYCTSKKLQSLRD